jgi:hypothetical protein
MPAIVAVTLVAGDTLRTVAGLELADGMGTAAAVGTAITPQQFRQLVDSLYEEMGTALKRGDLVAFGEAFNSLGRILSRPER